MYCTNPLQKVIFSLHSAIFPVGCPTPYVRPKSPTVGGFTYVSRVAALIPPHFQSGKIYDLLP